MIFLSSIRQADFNPDNVKSNTPNLSKKDIFNKIISNYLQLCWLNIEIAKRIKAFYIFNELEVDLKDEDVRKIEIGKIIFNFKKTNGHFRRLNPNQIQYVIEAVRNTVVINQSEYDIEKLSKEILNSELYFISNNSGDSLLKLIIGVDFNKLHPLQYSSKYFSFTELDDQEAYIELVKNILKERASSKKIGTYSEKASSIVEMVGRESWLAINEATATDKIFLRGGDNYLTEEVIRYLIKDKFYNFYWDFRDGIPELEKSFDSIVLFNIDCLPPSGQSLFWLRVRDCNYFEKLIIVTAKNDRFKFNSPIDFTQIALPKLSDLNKDILRALTLLINNRTPKHSLWQVPKNQYEHPFREMLNSFTEISEIDKVLERMELNKYYDHLFSVDFWYDFIKIKRVFQENSFPTNKHSITTYLLPLAEKEYDRIASYGKKYRFTRQSDGSFIIETPNGKDYPIKKSIALDYIYFMISNRYEYPRFIDISDLYTAVNGSEDKKGRDALLNKVRNSLKYLFNDQKPELKDIEDCFTISERGCYFEQKGSIRLRINSQQ